MPTDISKPVDDETVEDPLGVGLARNVEMVLQELDSEKSEFFETSFPQTQPRWFGLWIQPVISGERAQFLSQVIQRAMQLPGGEVEFGSAAPISGCGPNDLSAALETCQENQLALHVRLVPGGHSDGLKWRLRTHCPNCKASLESEFEQPFQCSVCEESGILNRVAPRKVLGTRPYLNLSRLKGIEATREFLKRYREQR